MNLYVAIWRGAIAALNAFTQLLIVRVVKEIVLMECSTLSEFLKAAWAWWSQKLVPVVFSEYGLIFMIYANVGGDSYEALQPPELGAFKVFS